MFRIRVNGSYLRKFFDREGEAHRTADALQSIRPNATIKVVRVYR